ncbi:MAG: hypothetical protein N3F67_03885 [Acidilobaceae archaeon]|nr:hypothetical protein [Acidilobaceae archaeon]
MGLNYSGVGIIAVVCKKCGSKLYWYSIGDKGNKNKFNGPPTPAKATSGYDGMRCPNCGSKLSSRPARLIFMSQKEFNERYIVGEYKLMNRVRKEILEGVSLEESISA